MINTAKISAIILAGGRGQRMGGADKGLVQWRGATLISQVIARLAPQVADIQISCNRHISDYRALGFTVMEDTMSDYQGPLAGIQACLDSAQHPLCLVCPCDTPSIPLNLVALLACAMEARSAEVAYPIAQGQHHYIPALMKTSVSVSLNTSLDAGNRSLHRWYRELEVATITWQRDNKGSSLENINSL